MDLKYRAPQKYLPKHKLEDPDRFGYNSLQSAVANGTCAIISLERGCATATTTNHRRGLIGSLVANGTYRLVSRSSPKQFKTKPQEHLEAMNLRGGVGRTNGTDERTGGTLEPGIWNHNCELEELAFEVNTRLHWWRVFTAKAGPRDDSSPPTKNNHLMAS